MRISLWKVVLGFGCLLCLPFAGLASSIPAGTYSLSGVSVNGSALTGNVTLDSSGLVTSANLGWNDPTYGALSFTSVGSTGTSGNNPVADFAYISGSNGQVALYYLAAFSSSGGITLCESGTGCSQASYLQVYSPNFQGNLSGGKLSAAAASGSAVTAEPSPFVLVATALAILAGVGVARKAGRQRLPLASGL